MDKYESKSQKMREMQKRRLAEGEDMYKEVDEKTEVMNACITIHGKDCMLTIDAREYKPELAIYDTHDRNTGRAWLDNPIYRGTLCGLVERLLSDRAAIKGLEKTLVERMAEISALEDNQIGTPIH